jgi:hypothetical protein
MRTLDFLVSGNGSRQVRTAKGEKYINIINPTGYGISIYRGAAELVNRFDFNPIYTNRTIPLPSKGQTEETFTLAWSGSGQDKFTVILSEENLGINQTLVSPGGGSSVSIVGDGVGLARGSQLPAALSGSGNLAIAILEDALGLLKASSLNLDGSKNVGVNLQNSLPAGVANIGKVDVNALPSLPAGVANIGKVDVNALPSLPAGGNTIGKVDINENLPLAATAGIVSTAQIAVGTSATVIHNAVVNGTQLAITNMDGANALFIGAAGVTTATGFRIPPSGVFTMDVIPGSTITIYGVGASALTAGKMIIN